MAGKLIVLEGTDGSGKATHVRILKEALIKKGFNVATYSYPDYGSVYGKLIESFLYWKINISVKEQFFIYLLDMIKDSERVKKDLKEGFVLMDRYLFSTVAYQCANGFDYDKAKAFINLMELEKPQTTVYIDVPVEISMQRKGKQKLLSGGSEDRFEKDRVLMENVKKVYSRMMAESFYAENWVRVDGSGSVEDTSKNLVTTLKL